MDYTTFCALHEYPSFFCLPDTGTFSPLEFFSWVLRRNTEESFAGAPPPSLGLATRLWREGEVLLTLSSSGVK